MDDSLENLINQMKKNQILHEFNLNDYINNKIIKIILYIPVTKLRLRNMEFKNCGQTRSNRD